MTPTSLTLRLDLDSDWGVATGTGIAGGVDDVVEREPGENGRPIVRATILTGIMREQAFNAARALDGPEGKAWQGLAESLFGTAEHPRLITFTDAPIDKGVDGGEQTGPTHTVVGLKIDEETGAAQDDFLRFFERAGKGGGEATIDFITEGLDRSPITWTDEQLEDARLLLALAAQLVTAVGSDRTSGDGACHAMIVDGDAELDRATCKAMVESLLTDGKIRAPRLPQRTSSKPALLASSAVESSPTMAATAELTIRLQAPLVSYEVPYSNEVRSLDFLRGTVLLPWIHSRLRNRFPDSDRVRDAVVSGSLRVSDATPVVGGVRGLPTPLVLSRLKTADGDAGTVELWNRLRTGEPKDVHVPVRSGFIFDGGEDHLEELALGAPALVGRQSTAISASTGAAKTGQLFMVRALPPGMVLRAEVSLSAELRDVVGGELEGLLTGAARLGSRRLSGTYGKVECELGPLKEASASDSSSTSESEGVTIWCVSDVLLRSSRLGVGGGATALMAALGGGIPLHPVPDREKRPDDPRYSVGLRHRRVDGWSAAGQQPRASRIAIQAGTALRLAPDNGAQMGKLRSRLALLEREGIGQLREQGYGRIVVGNRLLEKEEPFRARSLRQTDFVNEGQSR